MTASAVFELNDVRLRWTVGGEVTESSGCALIESDGSVQFGEPAFAQSRLKPNQVADEYWHRLDTQPVKIAAGNFQHHADLVYAHLMDFRKRADGPDQIDVVVPASASEAHLSMFLGIAQHAGIATQRMIDRAVLDTAASAADPGSEGIGAAAIHVEMMLHQTVVTRVSVNNGYWEASEVKSVSGAGLSDFIDAWSRGVAELFVKETRYDPLHGAESEQHLVDQLRSAFLNASIGHGLTIELAGRRLDISGTQITAWISRPLGLIEKAIDDLREKDNVSNFAILASGVITSIPGVSAALGDFKAVNTDVAWVDALIEPTDGGNVHVSRIKSGLSSELTTEQPADISGLAPTHVLIAERAVAIGDVTSLQQRDGKLTTSHTDTGCLIKKDVGACVLGGDLSGVTRNGKTAVSGPVFAGDELMVNGERALLIRVE